MDPRGVLQAIGICAFSNPGRRQLCPARTVRQTAKSDKLEGGLPHFSTLLSTARLQTSHDALTGNPAELGTSKYAHQ